MDVNVGYTGDIYLSVMFNCFVHLVMYNYYLFKVLHPTWNPWYKFMITNMQMTQFLVMNAQAIYHIVNSQCPYPNMVTKIYLGYILTLLVLFMNFAMKEYGGGGRIKRAEAAAKKSKKN